MKNVPVWLTLVVIILVVILSAARSSRSEERAESKDPYTLLHSALGHFLSNLSHYQAPELFALISAHALHCEI